MASVKRSLILLVSIALLFFVALAVKEPQKSEAMIEAEADLKLAEKNQERTKKLVWDLNQRISDLGRRIRTGKTLRTVIRKKPKKDPFGQLREHIMTSELHRIRASQV